ncbi:MAG TPA: hypothetical protein DFR83_20950 [Deltaproteobacteria bacterium]|nr:hypothetical protein [Deltaproteobacteria bacterium]
MDGGAASSATGAYSNAARYPSTLSDPTGLVALAEGARDARLLNRAGSVYGHGSLAPRLLDTSGADHRFEVGLFRMNGRLRATSPRSR